MTEPRKIGATASWYVTPGEDALWRAIQSDLALAYSKDPRDVAERERRKRERDRRERELLNAAQERHLGAVRGLTGMSVRLLDILNLHGPKTSLGEIVCKGCESEGYEAEYPSWPCRTWEIAAGDR